MAVAPTQRELLRRLAGEVAEIASLPVQQAKAEMWRKLNRLESARPMVWINEVCWEQMGPDVACRIEDRFLRGVEGHFRRTLYQWRHFPADMVVDDCFFCPVAFHDTGYGLEGRAVRPEDVYKGAVDYVSVIREPADVERIQMPRVRLDPEESARRLSLLDDIFGDLLVVRRRGVSGTWFSPWDALIQWYGIEELYSDMCDRPELVHLAIGRMTDAMVARYEQYERLGLLSLNNCNLRVGAGGLGFTDELPADDFDGERVRMKDMWGNSAAQIFSGVSPAMHEEFALRYELRFLRRFGLNCYGCCEPLHRKVGILRQIPRLRRISMSPFVDVAEGAEAIGGDYIYSAKPNPAVLAAETWNADRARQYLREILQATRGLHVELIMKDIHTVRDEPQRLSEWSRLAVEMAEECAA